MAMNAQAWDMEQEGKQLNLLSLRLDRFMCKA